MAGLVNIRVQGDRELTRALAQAGQALSDRAIMTGLKAGAIVVTNDAKRLAPFKTGTLKRSIAQKPIPGKLAVAVGTDVPYAARMEYGFVGRDKLGRRYNQPARPYLRPALRENTDEVRNIVLEVIRMRLKAAAT